MDIIVYAVANNLNLNHYAGPNRVARENITIEQAEEILSEDPELIFVTYPGAPIAWDAEIDMIITASFIVAERGGKESFESWCDNPDNPDYHCDPAVCGGYEWGDLTNDLKELLQIFEMDPTDEAIEKAMLIISEKYLQEDTSQKYAKDAWWVLGHLARQQECRFAQERQEILDSATHITCEDFVMLFSQKKLRYIYPDGMSVLDVLQDPGSGAVYHPEIVNIIKKDQELFFITDHINMSTKYKFKI